MAKRKPASYYQNPRFWPDEDDANKAHETVGCFMGGCIEAIVGIFILILIVGTCGSIVFPS